MNTLPPCVAGYLCLHLDPSSVLRMTLVETKYNMVVFDKEWWTQRYTIDTIQHTYFPLPSLTTSIPDISLFCRTAMTTMVWIESMWKPKKRRLPPPEGIRGEKGEKGSCGGPRENPAGRIGQTGALGACGGPRGEPGIRGEIGPACGPIGRVSQLLKGKTTKPPRTVGRQPKQRDNKGCRR